jgi:sucrose-6-phosphate hydrolase SacC (GH32 family)
MEKLKASLTIINWKKRFLTILPTATQYENAIFSGMTLLKWKTVSVLENDPEDGENLYEASFYQRSEAD